MDRHLQPGDTGITGVFQLEQPAVTIQAQKLVKIRTHRLTEIEGRFRTRNHHLDPVFFVRTHGVDERPGCVQTKGDRIFIRQGDGFFFHQQVCKSRHVQFAMSGELFHIDVGAARKSIDRLDSHCTHSASLSTIEHRSTKTGLTETGTGRTYRFLNWINTSPLSLSSRMLNFITPA